MTPQCVITGCDLKVGLIHYSCDLFEMGDTWIANGNVNAEGLPLAIVTPFYTKRLEIVGDFFHRRGVFVVRKGAAVLNAEAAEYIEKGKRDHA